MTTNPAQVEYILKTRFENFPKGEYIYDILHDLFGDGIFAVDGEKWTAQRKTASHMFAAREFREVTFNFKLGLPINMRRRHALPPLQNIMVVFHRHGAELMRILGRHADSGEPLDLQDLFYRFTLVRGARYEGASACHLLTPSLPASHGAGLDRRGCVWDLDWQPRGPGGALREGIRRRAGHD